MAIAFDAATDLGSNGGSTNSLTHAHVCTGSNLVLIVNFVGDNIPGNDDITGVTYNGVSMTLIDKVTTLSDRYNYVYILVGPSTGSNNVVINCTNNHYLVGEAASYTGCAQTGQPDSHNKSTGTPTANVDLPTVLTSTVADNCWVILGVWEYNGLSAGTGTTVRIIESTFNGGGIFDSNGVVTPPGTKTLNTKVSNPANSGRIIFSIAPFIVSGNNPFFTTEFDTPRLKLSSKDANYLSSLPDSLVGHDIFFGSGSPQTYIDTPPRRKNLPPPDWIYQGLLTYGKDQFFTIGGPQYDYPNPNRKRNLPDLLSHSDTKINFLGKDTFFGPPGMGPNYDYPNPNRRTNLQDLLKYEKIIFPSLVLTFSNCSWAGHFIRNSWGSPADQVNAGYPIYIQPSELSGSYSKILDFGTSAINIIINLTYSTNVIVPGITLAFQIAWSNDNITYTNLPAGTSGFITSNFRYIKVTITFTASTRQALTELTNLTVNLSVQQIMDSGTVSALASDSGGTLVTMTRTFLAPPVITFTPISVQPIYAVATNVTDTTFNVLIFDSSGNRISETIGWHARGIAL
jgi:hypothetical protein